MLRGRGRWQRGSGNTRQPGAFIFTGLNYGPHKIKLINKQSTKVMIIDFFGHLVPLNSAYPFVIFHAPKIDATGYATSPANASNGIIDALNGKIDSLVATFPAGYPVYVAPTNSFFTNTTASGDLDVADHIHPTNQGHRHIYDAAVSVFGSLPTTTGLARRLFCNNDRPYTFDNTNTARGLVYQGEAAVVAGSNKQLQYNNGGAFGGATGFEYGNTNNIVKIEAQAATDVPLLTKGFSGQSADHIRVTSSANATIWKVDGLGGMQVLGALGSPTGSGSLELEYLSSVGYVSSYNRGGSSWQNLNLRGAAILFSPSGTTKANVGSVGIYAGGSTAATSTLQSGGSFATAYTGTATGITLDATHSVVNVTATGQTITLPTAVGITGRHYTVKLTASGSGTVATTSSQTIDGSTTYSLASQYKYVTVVSDGANWIVIANN